MAPSNADIAALAEMLRNYTQAARLGYAELVEALRTAEQHGWTFTPPAS
jgi:hypothetical protein